MYSLVLFISTLLYANSFVSNDYLNSIFNNNKLKWSLFELFLEKYNKKYINTDEKKYRYEIFNKNIKNIVLHNNNRNKTFFMSINSFSDLDFDEFKKEFSNSYNNKLKIKHCKKYITNYDYNNLPLTIDWSYLYDVNNQMSCGSCYAFSGVESIEGAYQIKYNQSIILSKQQIVDCSKLNNGCDGGLYDYVFMYAMNNALCKEKDYIYTSGITGETNKCKECQGVVKIDNCYDVEEGNQKDLKNAVTQQPVSIAIAVNSYFQHYSSGIITDIEKCPPEDLNHAVLITGYGEENGVKYWNVMNSWGKEWGENGYVKMVRSNCDNDLGVCGISSKPSFPVII